MKKLDNKFILILAFMAVFFITTGSTYALCDVDPTIKTIRWFGDTTLEILKYTGYISLAYGAANACYNYHYYIPKIGQSIFLIKWGDKINGWLGFSSKGVLEQELELAKQTYSPLYKDAISGFNTNLVSPLLGYLGIRPLIVEKQVPIFVDRVRTEYRDRVETRIEYRTRDNENILSVRDSIYDLRSAIQQNTILTNDLQQNFADLHAEISRLELLGRLENLHVTDLQDICRLDNEWLPSNHQVIRIEADDEFMLSTGYAAPGLRVFYRSKSIFANAQSEHSLLISGFWFCNTYPKISELIDGYSSNAVTTQIKIAYRNNIIDSSNCSFTHLNTGESLRIVDFIKNNALSTINETPTNLFSLIARVEERLDSFPGRRSNQGSQTDNMSEHSVVLDQVESFLDTNSRNNLDMLSRQDPADSIFGVSSTNISAAATMGTLGIIGSISLLPVNDIFTIFSHFLGLSHFEPLLANPDAVRCLVNIYAQATGSIPGILADACTLPNPQDFLLPGESLLEPNTPTMLNNLPNPNPSNFSYLGIGLAFIGTIGLTWYLTKYGMDATPAVQAAKTLQETLREKYVNFK